MLTQNQAPYKANSKGKTRLSLEELEQRFQNLESEKGLKPWVRLTELDWDKGVVEMNCVAQDPRGVRFWSHVRRFKVWKGKTDPNFVRRAELVAKRNCYRKFYGRKRLAEWIGSF